MFTKLWGSKHGHDEERQKNAQSIIAKIHSMAPMNPEPRIFNWECGLTDEHMAEGYVAECNKWSEAASQGDWCKVLEIAAEEPDCMERYANITRYHRSPIDPSHPPSGYTVLHQAASHNAPVEVVKALIELGSFRQLHSTDGKFQRPVDIAQEKGFTELVPVLQPPPDLIPYISSQALSRIQTHFEDVVRKEAKSAFKPESMRVADLCLLREVETIFMTVPGIYGSFEMRFEGDHLVTRSSCRVVGTGDATYHITAEKATLVQEGWG